MKNLLVCSLLCVFASFLYASQDGKDQESVRVLIEKYYDPELRTQDSKRVLFDSFSSFPIDVDVTPFCAHGMRGSTGKILDASTDADLVELRELVQPKRSRRDNWVFPDSADALTGYYGLLRKYLETGDENSLKNILNFRLDFDEKEVKRRDVNLKKRLDEAYASTGDVLLAHYNESLFKELFGNEERNYKLHEMRERFCCLLYKYLATGAENILTTIKKVRLDFDEEELRKMDVELKECLNDIYIPTGNVLLAHYNETLFQELFGNEERTNNQDEMTDEEYGKSIVFAGLRETESFVLPFIREYYKFYPIDIHKIPYNLFREVKWVEGWLGELARDYPHDPYVQELLTFPGLINSAVAQERWSLPTKIRSMVFAGLEMGYGFWRR